MAYATVKPLSIRSIFSSEILYPPEWYREMEELKLDLFDLMDIIDLYEFYIALIMRCTSFIHYDSFLREKSDLIWEQFEKDKINKYEKNPIFIEMIAILNEFKKNYNYGAGIDRDHTIKSYKIINDLSNYCFGENKKKLVKVSVIIRKSKADITDSLELVKEISVYCFNQNEYYQITSLLGYFERLKNNLYIEFSKKQLSVYGRIDEYKVTNITAFQTNQQFTFNSSFVDDKFKLTLEEIQKYYEYNVKELKRLNKKIEEVKKEVIEYILRYPWVSLCINKYKLGIFVEYPEFIDVLNKLIEFGYVEYKESEYFRWKYKDVVNESKTDEDVKLIQPKLNILCCLILDFVFLPTNQFDDYKQYCTPKRFEPFSIAFHEPNLHDNAKGKDQIMPPKEYKELIRKLCLTSNWSL